MAFSLLLSSCEGTTEAEQDGPVRFDVLDGRVSVRLSADAVHGARETQVNLERTVRMALTEVDRHLELPATSVQIDVDSDRVNLEVGIGGQTDPQGKVFIWLSGRSYRSGLRVWLPVFLAHELHHSVRVLDGVDGPGYPDTLLEALVLEGLAESFSLEVFPKTPHLPWIPTLPEEQEALLWRKARRELRAPYDRKDHQEWFLGAASDRPRFAGRTLGFGLVQSYLEVTGKSAAESVVTPAASILRGSDYAPAAIDDAHATTRKEAAHSLLSHAFASRRDADQACADQEEQLCGLCERSASAGRPPCS